MIRDFLKKRMVENNKAEYIDNDEHRFISSNQGSYKIIGTDIEIDCEEYTEDIYKIYMNEHTFIGNIYKDNSKYFVKTKNKVLECKTIEDGIEVLLDDYGVI